MEVVVVVILVVVIAVVVVDVLIVVVFSQAVVVLAGTSKVVLKTVPLGVVVSYVPVPSVEFVLCSFVSVVSSQ